MIVVLDLRVTLRTTTMPGALDALRAALDTLRTRADDADSPDVDAVLDALEDALAEGDPQTPGDDGAEAVFE